MCSVLDSLSHRFRGWVGLHASRLIEKKIPIKFRFLEIRVAENCCNQVNAVAPLENALHRFEPGVTQPENERCVCVAFALRLRLRCD